MGSGKHTTEGPGHASLGRASELKPVAKSKKGGRRIPWWKRPWVFWAGIGLCLSLALGLGPPALAPPTREGTKDAG